MRANKSFQTVTIFKYLGTIPTDKTACRNKLRAD
jgi:hypothetical protein